MENFDKKLTSGSSEPDLCLLQTQGEKPILFKQTGESLWNLKWFLRIFRVFVLCACFQLVLFAGRKKFLKFEGYLILERNFIKIYNFLYTEMIHTVVILFLWWLYENYIRYYHVTRPPEDFDDIQKVLMPYQRQMDLIEDFVNPEMYETEDEPFGFYYGSNQKDSDKNLLPEKEETFKEGVVERAIVLYQSDLCPRDRRYPFDNGSFLTERIRIKKRPYFEVVNEILKEDHGDLKFLGFPIEDVFSRDAVLKPYDNLIDGLLARFADVADLEKAHEMQRFNPTRVLKIRYMKRLNVKPPLIDENLLEQFETELNKMFFEDLNVLEDQIFIQELRQEFLNYEDFSKIVFKNKSAVGYPLHKDFQNRKDAFQEAERLARIYFKTDVDDYKHYWLTGGRAVLKPKNSEPKARLVQYQGMPYFLLAAKYCQPFTRMMVRKLYKTYSAIGHSWFNLGAEKIKNYLEGAVDEDPNFISLDISGWDTSVSASLLRILKEKHLMVIRKIFVNEIQLKNPLIFQWLKIMDWMYEDMIKAKIVLPYGVCFQTNHGMKSGWAMTAVDNTLLHIPIVKIIKTKLFPQNKFTALVYGDDNLICYSAKDKPVQRIERIKQINELYLKFGFTVSTEKTCHSDKLSDVDFLSKYIMQINEHVIPYRYAWETYARLIYPECYDQKITAITTAERVIGHWIDNFCNTAVNQVLYKILDVLKNLHKQDEIQITEYFKNKMFGLERDKMPAVPPLVMITELYGFTEQIHKNFQAIQNYDFLLNHLNNIVLQRNGFDINIVETSKQTFALEEAILDFKADRAKKNFKHKRLNEVRNALKISKKFYYHGAAGSKLCEVLKENFRFCDGVKTILDVGSHPGSNLRCLKGVFPDAKIEGISLYPEIDQKNGYEFCYKAKDLENVEVKVGDARFMPVWKGDLAVIDISVGLETNFTGTERDSKNESTRQILDIFKNIKAKNLIIKFENIDEDIYSFLYQLFSESEVFWLKKPIFSSPWTTEVYLFIKGYGRRRPNIYKKTRFNTAINALRYSIVSEAKMWRHVFDQKLYENPITLNPVQDDEKFQKGLFEKVFLGREF